MRIQDAVKQIRSKPDGWVRADRIRRIAGGLEVCLGVYKGRRGRMPEVWRIRCLGVKEFLISDLNGGGLALYSSSHPAARQFVARKAVLRWSGSDNATVLGALHRAHRDEVCDWIEMAFYSKPPFEDGKQVCRGPDFLLRAYAKALGHIGANPRLTLEKKIPTKGRPKVLHFGNSFIVAQTFLAERDAESQAPRGTRS
jgi:hypothetical protein